MFSGKKNNSLFNDVVPGISLVKDDDEINKGLGNLAQRFNFIADVVELSSPSVVFISSVSHVK